MLVLAAEDDAFIDIAEALVPGPARTIAAARQIRADARPDRLPHGPELF